MLNVIFYGFHFGIFFFCSLSSFLSVNNCWWCHARGSHIDFYRMSTKYEHCSVEMCLSIVWLCVCVCVRVFIIKSTKSTWIVCECDCETSLIELNFGAIFLLLQLCTQNMNSLAFFVTYFLFRNKNDENICIDRAWYHCSFIPKWVAIYSKYKCKCLRLF